MSSDDPRTISSVSSAMWSHSPPTGICSMSPLIAVSCLLLGIAFTISLRTRLAGGIGVPRFSLRRRQRGLADHQQSVRHHAQSRSLRSILRRSSHSDLVRILPNFNAFSLWEKDKSWVDERFTDLTSREGERVDDPDSARGWEPRNNFKQCQRSRG